MTTLCFVFGRTQGCALSFFVRFSEKPGFCGYFLEVRTLFRGRRTKTASIGSVATLPAKYLTRRTCRAGDFLFGEAPNPLYQITTIERM